MTNPIAAQYVNSQWRQNLSQGFILDSGVHQGEVCFLRDACSDVAVWALRRVLRPKQWRVISAKTTKLFPELPLRSPADTVHAIVELDDLTGSLTLSWGNYTVRQWSLSIVGEKGMLSIERVDGGYHLTVKSSDKTLVDQTLMFTGTAAMHTDVCKAFEQANGAIPYARDASPEEALEDVKFVQALLDASGMQF